MRDRTAAIPPHFMRALRPLALLAVLLAAYFAQYLFDNGTLAHLYPAWMIQRFPLLIGTTLWLPEDIYTLALGLLGGSALIFGLLAPAWGEASGRLPGSFREASRKPLLAVLAGTALLVAWGWTALPARIDAVTARFGLEAQALLAGDGSWLSPGVTGAPRLAGLPAGLLTLILGSGPAASHLLGLLAALGTVAATYFLAAELFDAAAHPRALGLLAAGFTGCALATLHFGRLAPFLPATAAGTAAAWLLLAGERRQQRSWLAASGILTALACYLDRSGWVFALVLLVWWLGIGVSQRAGMRSAVGEVRRNGEAVPADLDERRSYPLRTWVTWPICVVIGLAPLLMVWLMDPSTFGVYLRGGQDPFVPDWWANLRATAATFFWTADASAVFGPAGHFVNSIVAPLFVLALGGLLLSLSRPLGWRLLSWLLIGLLFSSANNAIAPYWPTLLPLLPLVGIIIAYALDRIRALWEEAAGAASEASAAGTSATASVAVGLLLAVAAVNAAAYYQFAADGDAPSYTGRALAGLGPDAVALLAASTPEGAVRLDDPVVQFAAGPRANQALAVLADALPPSLPAGSMVLVQGADRAALAAVQTQYPQAGVEVVRDLNANPRLYVLRIGSEP